MHKSQYFLTSMLEAVLREAPSGQISEQSKTRVGGGVVWNVPIKGSAWCPQLEPPQPAGFPAQFSRADGS